MVRIAREFWQFAREEGGWWLLPIGLLLAAISLVAAGASGPLAPFVYAMF